MQFVLAKERQEADHKRIEAKGITDFQTMSTKVIILGSGKDGLPVILDT